MQPRKRLQICPLLCSVSLRSAPADASNPRRRYRRCTTVPARAQGTWVETRCARAICGDGAAPVADTDGLAKRLKLTDPQKAALKDLADASASADASAKKALCADKPDLSTTPGRMAFASPLPQPLNDAYRRGGVAECQPLPSCHLVEAGALVWASKIYTN